MTLHFFLMAFQTVQNIGCLFT